MQGRGLKYGEFLIKERVEGMDEFIHPFNVFLLSTYYVSVTVSELMEQIKPTFKKKVLLNIVCVISPMEVAKGTTREEDRAGRRNPC